MISQYLRNLEREVPIPEDTIFPIINKTTMMVSANTATLVICFSLLRSEEENLDGKILMMENIEETESSTSFPKLTF